MKSLLNKYYRYLRPFRFLYGGAKDRLTAAKASQRAAEWQAKGYKGAKFDICGGRNPYKPGEFLNVDIVDFPQVDLVFDIRQPFPIPDAVATEVFSAATLEHFRKHHNLHILNEFYRILQPGGVVQVCTPDIEAIAKALLAGHESLDFINQHFFGKFKETDTDDYDVHRWMYPVGEMIKTLEEIGFTNVEQIENETGLHDARYNYLVRGTKGI